MNVTIRAKIEAGFSLLLDRKAKENGVSIVGAIPLLLLDVVPAKMKPLLCEEYSIELPEGATFLDALNIAAEKVRSTEMIKTAIERHAFALARGIEELHQHIERMQTAFDEARQGIRNPDYRGGKMSAYEMLYVIVNMDIAEREYSEARGARVKIDRLLSTLTAELQDIQEEANIVLNTANIDLDVFALKKEFQAKGGERFIEEAQKLCKQHSGKPCPKKSARLLWDAYKIPIIGDVTFETALKYVLEKQKKGVNG